MRIEDRFDLGMDIICIKDFEFAKRGNRFHISGCGDLMYNCVSGKDGYGFGLTNQLNNNTNYITLEEACEYFITDREDYEIYLTDIKIRDIIK